MFINVKSQVIITSDYNILKYNAIIFGNYIYYTITINNELAEVKGIPLTRVVLCTLSGKYMPCGYNDYDHYAFLYCAVSNINADESSYLSALSISAYIRQKPGVSNQNELVLDLDKSFINNNSLYDNNRLKMITINFIAKYYNR